MRQLTILCFLILLPACSARKGVPHTEPLTATSEEVHQGEILFNQYCNSCHPNGTAGLGPALNNKPLPGFAIRFQIRNGVGVMPAFKEEVISDEGTKQIVAYLKELRKLEGQERKKSNE
jgi:mono/diheme cytochrome c family protein